MHGTDLSNYAKNWFGILVVSSNIDVVSGLYFAPFATQSESVQYIGG